MDISNLDVIVPALNSAPIIEKNAEFTLIKFLDQAQDKSGIVASYYTTDNSDLTNEQIVKSGIKADAMFIRLDKSITSIKLVLVDNAENISEIINVDIS